MTAEAMSGWDGSWLLRRSIDSDHSLVYQSRGIFAVSPTASELLHGKTSMYDLTRTTSRIATEIHRLTRKLAVGTWWKRKADNNITIYVVEMAGGDDCRHQR